MNLPSFYILGLLILLLGLSIACQPKCEPDFFEEYVERVVVADTFYGRLPMELRRTPVKLSNNECGYYGMIWGWQSYYDSIKNPKGGLLVGAEGRFYCKGEQIYLQDYKTQEDWLLFDFSMKVGDTIQVRQPAHPTLSVSGEDLIYELICLKKGYNTQFQDTISTFEFFGIHLPAVTEIGMEVGKHIGIIGCFMYDENGERLYGFRTDPYEKIFRVW